MRATSTSAGKDTERGLPMGAEDRRGSRAGFGFGLGFGAVLLGALLGLCAGGPEAAAFPPAPYHTLYGVARNEFGQPLEGSEVRIMLEPANGRPMQTSVGWVAISGANFVIRVPMDTGLFDAPYHPTAMRPTTSFRLKVMVGNTVYLPIEMRGDLKQLGKPGERTRLDLTLGEDTDGDGIPDAWERHLATVLGLAGIGDVKAGEDADGDGLSNLDEYLAGSYAYDPADGFRLDIVEKRPEGPVMEFLAIRGRTYAIRSSPDLKQWTSRRFLVVGQEETLTVYRAVDTRVVRVVALDEGAGTEFFGLQVE